MGHARGNRGACAEDGADVGENAVLDPSAVRMDFQKCLIVSIKRFVLIFPILITMKQS